MVSRDWSQGRWDFSIELTVRVAKVLTGVQDTPSIVPMLETLKTEIRMIENDTRASVEFCTQSGRDESRREDSNESSTRLARRPCSSSKHHRSLYPNQNDRDIYECLDQYSGWRTWSSTRPRASPSTGGPSERTLRVQEGPRDGSSEGRFGRWIVFSRATGHARIVGSLKR